LNASVDPFYHLTGTVVVSVEAPVVDPPEGAVGEAGGVVTGVLVLVVASPVAGVFLVDVSLDDAGVFLEASFVAGAFLEASLPAGGVVLGTDVLPVPCPCWLDPPVVDDGLLVVGFVVPPEAPAPVGVVSPGLTGSVVTGLPLPPC
jgi:hypothetical protein